MGEEGEVVVVVVVEVVVGEEGEEVEWLIEWEEEDDWKATVGREG